LFPIHAAFPEVEACGGIGGYGSTTPESIMNHARSATRAALTMGLLGLAAIGAINPPVIAQTVPPIARSTTEADRLLQQGIEQYDRAEYAAAVGTWEQALKQYQAAGNRKMVGETIRHLDRAAYAQNDNAKALEYFQESLTIARAVNNRLIEGRSLGNLGLVYDAQKQRDQALDYYQQSIAIAREVNDRVGEAVTSENLGRFYEYTDFSQAYTPFQNSLKIWRELRDRRREADVLLAIGNFYSRWSGNCSRAIEEAYAPSLPIFRELRDRSGEGKVLGGIGHCYAEADKHPEAIKYLNQSLVITREVKNQWYEGVVLTRLGKSHQALDELDNRRILRGFLSTKFNEPPITIANATQARSYAQQGLEIARAVKNRWGEALALEILGRSNVVLGDYQQAIAHQNARLKITRELNYPNDEARTLTDLAIAYEGLKNYPQAITTHQAALTIYRNQQTENARKNPNYSSEWRSWEMRDALIRLGDTYHNSNNDDQAVIAYREAQDPQKSSGGSFNFVLNSKLGLSLTKLGRFQAAETALRSAIDDEDDFRQAIATDQKSTDRNRITMAAILDDNYRQLQQALVGQNRLNDALEVAERSRARVFAELLAARISGQPILKNQALSEPPKIDAISAIAKAQNATLVQYSIVGPNLLYIWVIKPTGEISFRSTPLQPKQGIPQLVAKGRSEISVRGGRSGLQRIARTNRTDTATSGNLAKLHQVLIDPIAQDLPTDPNQRVIFMPQGELFLLPFAALRDAQGKYLIERHTISTAPSIQTLNLTRTQASQLPAQGRSVIVGDPTMPQFEGEVLPPLPGARQEAIAIGEILKTTPLLGTQATKATVLEQLRTASTVHFATHGLLDTIKGDMPGAIALAPSGADNGLLSASEIFDLKLRANLVVLSACDTGRGAINGDGVIGLSRSLIASGVPSVLVSLWAVDDNSTRVLMSDFYRQRQSNPNKAQALRQAMLNTMKQYPNPRDWAAFTIVGESD
jgi:CHAT domain-containing protein